MVNGCSYGSYGVSKKTLGKVTTPDKSVFEGQSKSMIESLKNQDEALYNLAMKIKAVE